MPFRDKVVLITGGGRGSGRAIAQCFAASGAKVVINDINPDTAAATAQEIKDAGGQAICLIADVANKMAVQTMHYEILETWGRVDILINHAAIEPAGAILTLDEWAWDRTLNVNLKGAFLCSQTVGRSMKEQGGGVIVNLGGAANGKAGLAAYRVSKTGLLGFTNECACEFAPYHIRVNAVCPSPFAAETSPALFSDLPPGYRGDPADVAGLALFLCSAEACSITGRVFHTRLPNR